MSAKQQILSPSQELQFARLKTAMNFAEAFIQRAKDALEEMKVKNTTNHTVHMASAKRISMELTRALAQLRKSPFHE